jgi:hypothetical protein
MAHPHQLRSASLPVFTTLISAAYLLLGGILPVNTVLAHGTNVADINEDGIVDLTDYSILAGNFFKTTPSNPRADINVDGIVDMSDYSLLAKNFLATDDGHTDAGDSMAMSAWAKQVNTQYDHCDDGTDVVQAHNQYYVIAYDGTKYPTWHPPVVKNPITGVGKCYFGHEHGLNPQKYQYWTELYQHFGKDVDGDGTIEPMLVAADGTITPGDHAGIPFGIANEMMERYYNQEGRDSLFVRHEDHVGHKVVYVNGEADMIGNSTHVMGNNTTGGINVPYGTSDNYKPTGVMCTHFHEFHQGTSSPDALRNNLHEVIFHSNCTSTASQYPNNTVLLTGMMAFGNPGEYARFCGPDRFTKICTDGKNPDGSCVLNDPLISRLPKAIYSTTLGRNMVDKYCMQNIDRLNQSFYFTPYEIWEGDLRITTASGKMIAEHGRQWDVLDPIRYVDLDAANKIGYNSDQCAQGGFLYRRTLLCEVQTGVYGNTPWNSPKSKFRGLKRTAYFGRNRVSNAGGSNIYWTDPLGGNATTTQFSSGLKQKISTVEADICKLPVCTQLNDRALQLLYDDGGGTVHAPN